MIREDHFPDIAYLARPCQFVTNDFCHRQLWTFQRYHPSVVNGMNAALNILRQTGDYQQLELIGYSGGATIALLLAALRDDVISVRTVAGNLAPHYLNRHHGVSEMREALSPINAAGQLMHIPQIHWFGRKDSVVPPAIAQHYRQHSPQRIAYN